MPVAERLRARASPTSSSSLDEHGRRRRGRREVLEKRLGAEPYELQDWREMNKSLFSALWLEKMAISITIGLIVAVAALNIIASLVLLVMEKSRDIAILKTMGAPARAIRRIFMLQGLTIGFIGTAAGTVIGLIICFVADRFQLISLPGDVYQISYVPFRVQPLDVAVVVVSAIGRLLSRDDLSGAPGRPARSGRSAAVPIAMAIHRSRTAS